MKIVRLSANGLVVAGLAIAILATVANECAGQGSQKAKNQALRNQMVDVAVKGAGIMSGDESIV